MDPVIADMAEEQVLLSEMEQVKKSLYQLELFQAYEQVKFEPKLRTSVNLLEYLNRGAKQPRSGTSLDADITASRARLKVLEDRYADYQQRYEQVVEARGDEPS